MDAFCPSCLHSVTREARQPRDVSVAGPACAAEPPIALPQSPQEPPIVCPVRQERSDRHPPLAWMGTAAAAWIALIVVGCSNRDVDQAKAAAAAAQAADDEDEFDDEKQKEAAAKIGFDNILLTVGGKEVRLAVNQLTWFKARGVWFWRNRDFEFSGPDVSLRGSFPDFDHEWSNLLGRAVPISPHGDRPAPGESHLKLPGRGLVKVVGGKFATVGAMTAGPVALFGMIQLEIGEPKKPETVRGMFSVRVKEAD
jgi:hypothetical protein